MSSGLVVNMPKPARRSCIRINSAAGRSGLGLDAQRKAVAQFAAAEGFTIVAEFTGIETGKGADAP